MDRLRRRAGWQNVGRANESKSTKHRHDFLFSIALRESFQFRQSVEGRMRMAIVFRDLNDRMIIHEPLLHVVGGSLQDRVRNIRARVELSPIHCEIELRPGIARDKLRILKAEYPGKEPAVDIDVVSDGLRADANPWTSAQFFQAVQAQLGHGTEDVLRRAVRCAKI